MELDHYEEDWYERVTSYVALRIRNTCHFDKTLKNAFKKNIEVSRMEILMYEPIEEVTKQMIYFHSLHEKECCAC